MLLRFNGSTSGYSDRTIQGNGSGTPTSFSNLLSGSYLYIGEVGASGTTASTFSNHQTYIPNYASSNNKSASIDDVVENNATTGIAQLVAGLWANSAGITSITISNAASSNFVAGSTFSLYGIAALGTTPVIAPKAIGGNIIDYDGTNWIHTFLTSGTFTPLQGITCDYLVVAGGGSGAGGSGGVGSGGGGAGGYRTATGSSLIAATNYSVTIGAGAASVNTNVKGNNGNDSIFDTITSTGGGGGGAFISSSPGGNSPGNNGGSGGGGGTAGDGSSAAGGSGNTPSTSPSQGNNGGAGGTGAVSPFRGGGGGGASAVGATASASGNGGAGTASSITGTSVTRAGGGGGGGNPTGGAGGSGGGGAGASGGGVNGTSGTANTGGGGGGATGISANSGSGGSGVVIIRYPAA